MVLVTTTTPMLEKLHHLLDQYLGRADPNHLYEWQAAIAEVNWWAIDRDAPQPPKAKPVPKPKAKVWVAKPRLKREPKPLAASKGSLLGGPVLGIDDDT